jgi:hypothetical protein
MLDAVTAPPAALGVDVTPEPVVPLPPPRPRPSRRVVAVVAGAVALVVAGVVAVAALRPPPHSDDPVVIPETLLGMPASPLDFAADPGWSDAMEFDGAVGGRGYSPAPAKVPQVNLMVVRQDISGDDDPGDVGMAGDVEEVVGRVSCTQTLDFSSTPDDVAEQWGIERDAAERSESMLVCWRADDLLTVSVFVIGIDVAPFTSTDVAAAIDEVWALQG